MSPVEAVARAIDPDAFNPNAVNVWRRSSAIARARAALAALRTPTPAMVEAMDRAARDNGLWADLWQAAIDAAMEENNG